MLKSYTPFLIPVCFLLGLFIGIFSSTGSSLFSNTEAYNLYKQQLTECKAFHGECHLVPRPVFGEITFAVKAKNNQ